MKHFCNTIYSLNLNNNKINDLLKLGGLLSLSYFSMLLSKIDPIINSLILPHTGVVFSEQIISDIAIKLCEFKLPINVKTIK